VTGSVHLLGRRGDAAAAVALARHHGVPFYRLVPLRRGFLIFENREAPAPTDPTKGD
jgi:hypothetical protein